MNVGHCSFNDSNCGFNQENNSQNRNFDKSQKFEENQNYDGSNAHRQSFTQSFSKLKFQILQQLHKADSFLDKSVKDVNLLINPSWDDNNDIVVTDLMPVASSVLPEVSKSSDLDEPFLAFKETISVVSDVTKSEIVKLKSHDCEMTENAELVDWDCVSLKNEISNVEKVFDYDFLQSKTNAEIMQPTPVKLINSIESSKTLDSDCDLTGELSKNPSISDITKPLINDVTPTFVHSPPKPFVEESSLLVSEERQRPSLRVRNVERTLNHLNSELNGKVLLHNKNVTPFGSFSFDEAGFSNSNSINLPDINVDKNIPKDVNNTSDAQLSELLNGKSTVISTNDAILQIKIEPDLSNEHHTYPKIIVTALNDGGKSFTQDSEVFCDVAKNQNKSNVLACQYITKSELEEIARISQKIFQVYGEMNALLQRLSQR